MLKCVSMKLLLSNLNIKRKYIMLQTSASEVLDILAPYVGLLDYYYYYFLGGPTSTKPQAWKLSLLLLLLLLLLWPPYVIGQAVIFLPCGFFVLSFYLFPRLISAVADYMSAMPYFHTWCSLSANLRRRSETCCTRLAENTRRKMSPKIAICMGTIAQICRAIS